MPPMTPWRNLHGLVGCHLDEEGSFRSPVDWREPFLSIDHTPLATRLDSQGMNHRASFETTMMIACVDGPSRQDDDGSN
jgi:hypothetical protein